MEMGNHASKNKRRKNEKLSVQGLTKPDDVVQQEIKVDGQPVNIE